MSCWFTRGVQDAVGVMLVYPWCTGCCWCHGVMLVYVVEDADGVMVSWCHVGLCCRGCWWFHGVMLVYPVL